ncbi:unnamed protein product [Peronospora belbahrii]|uniref:RecA family profile 1 domain-containing protein n=1 Tax=Peronospora belbahrii TaxID=622444 RepID=A0AAU9KMR2_9STRA|nr:unnamed protein product [Peronospora belbahrii]CAH0519970.1 unnamed protein product [Peronospora belbahrii]
MLRFPSRVLRHAYLFTTIHQSPLSNVLRYGPLQSRSMGTFSNLKNQIKNEMDKNEELKNYFEELEKTKEQYKSVEKVAKTKMSEMSSITKVAAKSFQEQASQASQNIKESYENTTKVSKAAKAETKACSKHTDTKCDCETEKFKKDGEDSEGTNETIDGAREFVKNFFASIGIQKNRLVHPNKLFKLRDEWMEAAQELFGKTEKKTVDEALASVRTPSIEKVKKAEVDDDEHAEYTGTSALVAVKNEESAWQRVSARFREAPIIQGILNAAKQAAKTDAGKKVHQTTKQVKDKLSDAQEEVLEVWETSQNPWVYRLSSIYDGLFGETPMGVAIKEIRRAEPDFILEEWKKNIEEIVLPGVLEAFLRGNSRDLKKWFGEAAYSRVNIAIRERKSEGLVLDPHVLSIDNVEVIEATAEDKQAPIILMRFQAQQINCIRNREGEIVEGSEDEVLAYYYIFAFQRDYDEEQESLRWRVVDLHMQRGNRTSNETLQKGRMGMIRSERHSKEVELQSSAVSCVDDINDEEYTLRSYEPIDLLQDAGINTTDIAKLKNGGFATIGQLFQVSQRKLLGVKGISESKMDKLLQAGRKLMPEKSGFVSANTLYLQSLSKIFITTGSKQFNKILGGGLETMSVTEVHGEYRTGKTQLCHTLCVTAQLPRSRGGGAGKVAFVDTEGTFRPNRVAEIAKERYKLDPEDVLDNIIVARAHSHDAQMDLIIKLGVLFADPDQGPFRLLIIDSVTALFRSDFSGKGELSERQQQLNQHLVRLVRHAEEFNIAVLVVNQVMADPGANVIFGSAMKPVGGHVMSHGVHTRVLMKKGRADNRICKIIDSPCMPEAECSIQLCTGGIMDSVY